MSTEQAIRFMAFLEKDAELKSKYQDIINQNEGKQLTEEELEAAILAEVIPLAKRLGFDFTAAELRVLPPFNECLTDEQLNAAVGGKGQFTVVERYESKTLFCDLAPDDETFRMYYSRRDPNGCPHFVYRMQTSLKDKWIVCSLCKYLHSFASRT